jgi:hypothetical protein
VEGYCESGDESFDYIRVAKFLCLTNKALSQEGVWGSGCINPRFIELDTSWK